MIILEWLKRTHEIEGVPVPNWVWIVVVLLLIGEDLIARSKLASNSTIQLVGSLIRKIPGVRVVLGFIGPKAPPAVLLLAGALGFGVAMGGCGGVTTAYRVIDSAAALGRTGFDLVHELDKEKQDAIADEKDRTGDVETAKAKLREWREKRDKARAALKTYAAAVATAGATLDLVVAGQEKRITIAMVLAEVAKAIANIKSVLDAFGVKVPLLSGVPPDEAARIAVRGVGWGLGKLAHVGGAR